MSNKVCRSKQATKNCHVIAREFLDFQTRTTAIAKLTNTQIQTRFVAFVEIGAIADAKLNTNKLSANMTARIVQINVPLKRRSKCQKSKRN